MSSRNRRDRNTDFATVCSLPNGSHTVPRLPEVRHRKLQTHGHIVADSDKCFSRLSRTIAWREPAFAPAWATREAAAASSTTRTLVRNGVLRSYSALRASNGASVQYFFETLGWAETCDLGIWAGIARLKT